MTYQNPTHTPACPGQTAHHRGSGGNYTHSILLKSAAAVLLLLLFCGVFCGAAAAADEYVANVTVDGGMIVYGLDFTVAGGYDVAYKTETIDGVEYASSLTSAGLAYSLDDYNLRLADCSDVALEIEYYDDCEDDSLIVCGNYFNLNNEGAKSISVPLKLSGEYS